MRLKNSGGALQDRRTLALLLLPRLSPESRSLANQAAHQQQAGREREREREREYGTSSAGGLREAGAHRCTARSKRTEAGTEADRTYDARSTAGASLAQHARCRPSRHIWQRGGSTSKGALSASLAPSLPLSSLPSPFSLYTSPQRRGLTNSPAIPILTDDRRQRPHRPATL